MVSGVLVNCEFDTSDAIEGVCSPASLFMSNVNCTLKKERVLIKKGEKERRREGQTRENCGRESSLMCRPAYCITFLNI